MRSDTAHCPVTVCSVPCGALHESMQDAVRCSIATAACGSSGLARAQTLYFLLCTPWLCPNSRRLSLRASRPGGSLPRWTGPTSPASVHACAVLHNCPASSSGEYYFRKITERKNAGASDSRCHPRKPHARRFLVHPFGSMDYIIHKSHRVHPDSTLVIRFDEVRTRWLRVSANTKRTNASIRTRYTARSFPFGCNTGFSLVCNVAAEKCADNRARAGHCVLGGR